MRIVRVTQRLVDPVSLHLNAPIFIDLLREPRTFGIAPSYSPSRTVKFLEARRKLYTQCDKETRSKRTEEAKKNFLETLVLHFFELMIYTREYIYL